MAQKKYVSLRVSEDTMDWIKDIRMAFEAYYLRRFTFDELMEKLRDCVENAEPGVWEKYCEVESKKEVVQ